MITKSQLGAAISNMDRMIPDWRTKDDEMIGGLVCVALNVDLEKTLNSYSRCIAEIEGDRERLQQLYDERPPGMVEHRAAETVLDALDDLKANLSK